MRQLLRQVARALFLFGLVGAVSAAGDPMPDAAAAHYHSRAPSRDGIGKVYMGREISHVMGHRGAHWLERPERARTEKPDLLVEALPLEPDAIVADIGAGTGYFSFRIASRLRKGRVLAVDIQPEMLARIESRTRAEKIENVAPVRGTTTDPNLPAGTIDLALIVDAYHEFSHPREMALALREDLAPDGKLILVEYRGEDPSVPIKTLHKMTEAQARKELEAVGFRWIETIGVLPQQHMLVFGRDDAHR
jgi:SAM-dependent methyltransferase